MQHSKTVYLASEDRLSQITAEKILKLCSPSVSVVSIGARGGRGPVLQRLSGYNKSAKKLNFFVLLDLDREPCAARFVRNCLNNRAASQGLLFRVAVREIEAWLLADRPGFSRYFQIPENRLPAMPDDLPDPKQALINVIKKRCGKRACKESIVPARGSRAVQGPGYTQALCRFVQTAWNARRAKKLSPSLSRCLQALSRRNWL